VDKNIVLEKIPVPDTMKVAKQVAKLLYEKYQQQEVRGCGELLVEWTDDIFYGRLMADKIPLFDSLWVELRKRGHVSRRKSLEYGDIDASVWAEQKGSIRIIINIRHCSMADNNTHIFIKDDPYPGERLFLKFRVVSAWPRELHYPKKWGEEWSKRVRLPSVHTHRRAGFKYGYEDVRDEGHVFASGYRNGEGCFGNGPKILHAIWTLGVIKDILEELK